MVSYKTKAEATEVAGQLRESEDGGWVYRARPRPPYTEKTIRQDRSAYRWVVECLNPNGNVEYW